MLRILDIGHYNSQLAALHLQSYHATAAYLFAGSYASSAADMLYSFTTRRPAAARVWWFVLNHILAARSKPLHSCIHFITPQRSWGYHLFTPHLLQQPPASYTLILHSHLAGARFLPEAVSTSRHAISLYTKSNLIALLFLYCLGITAFVVFSLDSSTTSGGMFLMV